MVKKLLLSAFFACLFAVPKAGAADYLFSLSPWPYNYEYSLSGRVAIDFTSQWGEFIISTAGIDVAQYSGYEITCSGVTGTVNIVTTFELTGASYRDAINGTTSYDFATDRGALTKLEIQCASEDGVGTCTIEEAYLIDTEGNKVAMESYEGASWGCTPFALGDITYTGQWGGVYLVGADTHEPATFTYGQGNELVFTIKLSEPAPVTFLVEADAEDGTGLMYSNQDPGQTEYIITINDNIVNADVAYIYIKAGLEATEGIYPYTMKFASISSTENVGVGDKFAVDGVYYNILSAEDKTVEVAWGGSSQSSGTDTYVGDLTIPATVTYGSTTYTVIGVGSYAFHSCKELTGIDLSAIAVAEPYINDHAFYGCSSLTSVKLPADITTLSAYVFDQCSSLDITIPETVTLIDEYALRNTAIKSVVVPESVTSVARYAFAACTQLTYLELPSTMTSVTTYLCHNSSALETVKFGAAVDSIQSYAFYGCASMATIDFPETLVFTGEASFRNCTSLDNVVLPASVQTLSSRTFQGCSSLKTMTSLNPTPPTVNSSNAFTDTQMTKEGSVLYVPEGCVDAYKEADVWKDFYSIEELEEDELVEGDHIQVGDIYYAIVSTMDSTVEVTWGGETQSSGTDTYVGDMTIPATASYAGTTYTVIGVGSYAFHSCTGLTGIDLSAIAVDEPFINDHAFYGCSSLTSVTFPENITTFSEYLFDQCSSLVVDIPSTVTSIQAYALRNTAYTELVVPETVTSIGTYAFAACSQLKSLTFPSTITSIPTYVCHKDEALEDVKFLGAVDSILTYAFYGCTSLATIDLPETLVFTGENTFRGCTSLDNVVLPASVQTLSSRTFQGCSSLKTMTSLNPTPPTVNSSNAFTDTQMTKEGSVLYVPEGCVDAYKAASVWEDFFDIRVIGDTSEPDGISAITFGGINVDDIAGYYSVDGRNLSEPAKGVTIVRLNDGTTKKIHVK